jgi:hypothetical protein
MKTKMTMKDTTQLKSLENKPLFWSASRLILGGILGVVAYLLMVKIIVEQTNATCYQTGLIRSVIEASMFPAWLWIESTIGSESSLYLLYVYGLSSIPYAILGALLAWNVKKYIILVVGLLTIFGLGLSVLSWRFFVASLCA